MSNYWNERKELNYYKKVIEIINNFNKESIIDIGSRNTTILNLINESYKDKTCLDIDLIPDIPEIKTIQTDFYTWIPEQKYDIIICLQVLEHLDDPVSFAKKLFNTANIIIISVPYKWKKGFCKYHVQDPIDEEKILLWTGIKPNEEYIIEDNNVKRIINVYY